MASLELILFVPREILEGNQTEGSDSGSGDETESVNVLTLTPSRADDGAEYICQVQTRTRTRTCTYLCRYTYFFFSGFAICLLCIKKNIFFLCQHPWVPRDYVKKCESIRSSHSGEERVHKRIVPLKRLFSFNLKYFLFPLKSLMM